MAERDPVALTGMAVVSAFGRGTDPLLAALRAGRPAVRTVTRFDVSHQRSRYAALLDEKLDLTDEFAGVVDEACRDAGLDADRRGDIPLLLAAHADPALVRFTDPARAPAGAVPAASAGAVRAEPGGAAHPEPGGAAGWAALADRCGTGPVPRTYTTGCVAASTAVVDAAQMIGTGRAERVLVAAGYLVDADYFLAFDAGRTLAPSGVARPFSADRDGMLLGDAVAAVVLESAAAARRRGATPVASLVGWGRAGDAYHVCQPHPDGTGLARAVRAALDRAGLAPEDIGYVNAHGTGTAQSDVAEASGLRRALGGHAERAPVSSTKPLHGHTLEASALIELIATVLTLTEGRLPVHANFTRPDPDCRLNLVLDEAAPATPYALSVNAAFGGANTALVVKVGD